MATLIGTGRCAVLQRVYNFSVSVGPQMCIFSVKSVLDTDYS